VKINRRDGPGFVHHITARVNWRAWLLEEDQTKRGLSQLIRDAAVKFDVEVFAAVLMSNHVHIVVRSPPEPTYTGLTSRRTSNRHTRPWPAGHQKATVIAQFMRHIRHRMSLLRQRELGLSGRFWEGDYDAKPITDAKSLAVRIAYDHRNPVQAKVVHRPEEYPWSTAATWLDGLDGPLPVTLHRPLPFELTIEGLRAEVLRLQSDTRLDALSEALRALFAKTEPVPDNAWGDLFNAPSTPR